jgi:outer membrane protein assembly factor BamD
MKYIFYGILLIFVASCSKVNKVLKSKDVEYKYKMANKYYDNRKYKLAQELLLDVMPFYRDKKEFQDLYYKYAYTAFYQKDYQNAENLFKNFAKDFPNSNFSEEADYMNAYSFFKQSPKAELDQTNTYKAIGLLQTFITNHPNSLRIGEATGIIDQLRIKLEEKEFKNAELYYNIGQFKSAAISFDNLIVNFPDSKDGDRYKLMVIKSFYKYAVKSVDEKKAERFAFALNACEEFNFRYADSPFKSEVDKYLKQIKTFNK